MRWPQLGHPPVRQPTWLGNGTWMRAAATTVSDSSGHGNNGTILGSAQWVPGRFGFALSFDGTTGRVQIIDNLALEPAVVGQRQRLG